MEESGAATHTEITVPDLALRAGLWDGTEMLVVTRGYES